MIEKHTLRNKTKQCLNKLGMFSTHALNLLMGTAAQESRFKYNRQLGGGPALGYFQMEPETFIDICNNYLIYKTNLTATIMELCGVTEFKPEDLETNVELMICFARLQYYRRKEPMPKNIQGYAEYWKRFYNTYLGKGTVAEFKENYKKYVLC